MAAARQGSYQAEIDTLDAGSIVPCAEWVVRESRQGWSGYGVVDAAPDKTVTYGEAFDHAINFGLRPEAPMALGLWARPPPGEESESEENSDSSARKTRLVSVRTWPSVVTQVSAPTQVRDRRGGVIVMFSDPVRFLLNAPVWGVYRDCSPGQLFGAGLSLAAGGEGALTLEPALPGLPQIKISEFLRESVQEVPYAVATGEPLGVWLAQVLGAFGIRAELVGRKSGRLDIQLRDSAPAGTPLSITLLPGAPSASNAAIVAIRPHGTRPVRDALYDGVSQGHPVRVGDWTPPIGQMIDLMEGLDVDEASYLADFQEERSELNLSSLEIVTEQPGVHPGRLLEFSNRSVTGASVWQVVRTCHGQGQGRYRNSVEMVKKGVAWRPETPDRIAPVTVTGVVDDGDSVLGEIVDRDKLGRIPVRIGMGLSVVAEDGTDLAPTPVQLDLSIAEPMAGGSHGFVPGHRQGDICRVSVHHPLKAEVKGFLYGFDNRVALNLLDASAAIMASNPLANWSGMVFRPGDDAEEEDVETVSSWRSGSPPSTEPPEDDREDNDAEGSSDGALPSSAASIMSSASATASSASATASENDAEGGSDGGGIGT